MTADASVGLKDRSVVSAAIPGLRAGSGRMLVALCVLSCQSLPPAWSQVSAPEPLSVELRSNERELYPASEAVAIRSMERAPAGIGLQLFFVSDMPSFSHFVYTTNGGSIQKIPRDTLRLTFEDRHTPDVQYTSTVIRSVDRTGLGSKDYHIDVNYYPRELYAKSGQAAPGYVVVKQTDIPIVMSRVSDWVLGRPTADEVAFARRTWAAKVDTTVGGLEKARMLARVLMSELQSHRGVPSDSMRTTALKQYQRATSGTDHVWCGNLAEIFVWACACFDVPARIISMGRTWSRGEAFDLLMAEGHATSEVFDESLNRWVWIDLTFLMTGMELAGYGPIQTAELHRYLNAPDMLRNLTALEYDPVAMTERRVSVRSSAHLNDLLNFFKKDQTFIYRRTSSG